MKRAAASNAIEPPTKKLAMRLRRLSLSEEDNNYDAGEESEDFRMETEGEIDGSKPVHVHSEFLRLPEEVKRVRDHTGVASMPSPLLPVGSQAPNQSQALVLYHPVRSPIIAEPDTETRKNVNTPDEPSSHTRNDQVSDYGMEID